MAKNILIKNGTVIDPANKINGKADVLAIDGKIAEVGNVKTQADIVIDAAGKFVLPGLIDIHTHGHWAIRLTIRPPRPMRRLSSGRCSSMPRT